MSKNYTLAKEVSDYTITDLDIKGELYKVDKNDNILLLSLQCDTVKQEKHDTNNMPNIIKNENNDISVIFSIWENILHRLYYSIINKQMNGYLLVHQDQNLWNGRSALGIHHINNYDISDDTITLWRYYTNTIDKYYTVGSDYSQKVDLSINEEYCNESTKTTLDGIAMICRSFKNDEIPVIDMRTNDLNFDVLLSAKEEDLEAIKNDPNFFKMRVAKDGDNKVQVIMKKPHSNDLNMSVSGTVTRTYKKDVYIDTLFYTENRIGKLYTEDIVLEGDNYKFTVKNYYDNEVELFQNEFVDSDKLSLTSFNRYKKESIDIDKYVNDNFGIDHIDSKYGSLYLYFSNTKIFNNSLKEILLQINGITKKYLRTDIIDHCDRVTLSKRVFYSTDYSYDYTNNIYTYKLEVTEGEIDDGDITEFTVTPSEKQENIKSIKIENGFIIIESKVLLCTYKSPNCNIKYVGNHSYKEYVDVYNDNYNFTFRINEDQLQTNEDGNLYYKYDYDIDNSDKYEDYGEIKNKWFSYGYKYTYYWEQDYQDINILLSGTISIESGKPIVRIPKEKYETFKSNYTISDLMIGLNFEYKKPILNKDVVFNEPVLFTAYFHSENKYGGKLIKDFTDEYKGRYLYEFDTEYNYLANKSIETTSNIEYSLEYDGYDIVYDVEYNNGEVKVYLFDDYKSYDYTDMSIAFNLSDCTQITQEIYETYKFTGKAKDKLEKIINYLSYIKAGDIAYSFIRLKNDLKDM